MSDQTIRLTLASLGLSEKEIDIYLCLLQVGTAPASTLGERTNIQRSTAQYTCQQLAKTGIIRMTQKGNAYLYSAEPPEKLVHLLEKQQQDLTKKEEQVHRIITELKNMMNPHAVLPKIRFYEGGDGVVEAYETVLKAVHEKGTILSYLHPLEKEQDVFGLYKEFWRISQAFDDKGITSLTICPRSKMAEEIQKDDNPPQRMTRLIDPIERMCPVEIIIFNDSLFGVTVEQRQIFAYIVENKAITQMHRHAFWSLWNSLEGKKK